MFVHFKKIDRRVGGILFAAVIFTGLAAVRAQAATTWTVNTTADSNDGSCGSTCSLRDAITAANADSGDTIQFASSLIGGTITLGGTLIIATTMTITGPGANFLTISGGNAVGVLNVIINGPTVALSGLTIAGGNSATAGGGLANLGNVTITGCTFTSNVGAGGGAIFSGGGSSLSVSNSTFSGNSSVGGPGGAILSFAALPISYSTFTGNSASSSAGGAIFNANDLAVSNSTFTGNTAVQGGGIYSSIPTPITVNSSILSGDTGGECTGNGCPTNGSNGNVVGVAANLAPLGWYGGTTPTMIPLPTSAAICAGASSAASFDQRGFASGNATTACTDAGAVQTNYLVVNTLTDQTDTPSNCPISVGGTCSLRDAVSLAGTSPNTNGADITFASGLTGTIDLSTVNTSLTQIAGDLNLMGPGAGSLTISGGSSSSVGTIFVVGSTGQMTISGVTLANGRAVNGGNGGGMYNSGSLVLSNAVISASTAPYYGDGIYQNNGSLYAANTTFSNNFGGTAGGGICVNEGAVSVMNSTFYDNLAGAIFQSQGTVMVNNSTFTGNVEQFAGGAIDQNGGLATVVNSILSNNTAADNPGSECYGSVVCTNGSNGNVVGVDASLTALGNYGGPVPTLLPLPGSPAICAGLPSLDAGVSTDQRGFPRLNTTYPGYSSTTPCADAGAVQTNYQSLQFLQTGYSGLPGGPIDTPTQPIVTVTENNQNLGGVPITLSLSGTPTYTNGLGPVTTVAGAGATFDSLIVSPGGDYTLSTSLNVLSGLTLNASADLSIANIPATTSAISAPTITYGSVAYVTVTVSSIGGTPTGNVSLSVAGGSPITQALSGGVTTFTLTGLNAGTFSLSTSYLPQNGWGGSYATSELLVNKAVPTFSDLSSPTITGGSTPTTFWGTLNANANGQLVPSTESVTISFSSVSQSAPLNGSDQFSANVTTVAVDPDSTYTVTYSYGGDSNFFPATGTGTLTVTPASTRTVTDNSDDPSDTGSLRYCVNNSSNGAQIIFNTPLTGGNTITLDSANGPLAITTNITIAGPGSSQLTVSGGNAVGVFTVGTSLTVTISGLTISNGKATQGGGIYVNNGNLTVENCTFTGNQASSEGGAMYSSANPGSFTVTNSTFTNNTATSSGGAVYAYRTFTISGSTFTGNSSANGGGILAFGTDKPYTVESSTIWGNTATSGADITNENAMNAFNNLMQTCLARGGHPCAGATNGVNGNYQGSAPNLAPLGWYGGSTQTMPPLPGSPVICAGNTANLDPFVTTDQRGFARLNTTYTGYSGSNPCLDAGSVQTNYQSVQFTNVPVSGYYSGIFNQDVSPAPVVTVTESNQSIGNIPVTLAFAGTGTGSGLGPVTTNVPSDPGLGSTGAAFSTLSVNAPGSDTLTATLAIEGTYSITAEATLDVTALATTTAITGNTPNPSVVGQPVSVTFTVTPTTGTGTPTGSVTVNASTGESCTGSLTSGTGNCFITFSSAGPRTLAASYGGDSTFASSTSTSVSQSVKYATAASVFPTALAYGNQTLNTTSVSKSLTMTSTGLSSLTISSIFITGANSGDFGLSNGCTAPNYSPGAKCTMSVTFTPSGLGPESASLVIIGGASGSQSVALSGTGVQPVVLNPTSLNFANVGKGSPSVSRSITLNNYQYVALGIVGSITTGNPDFAESDTCGSSVPARGHCVITITFTPSTLTAESGTVTINDNATTSPQTASLAGTGILPVTLAPVLVNFGNVGQHSPSLSRSVTLINRQTTTLNITSITTGNPDFAESDTCGGSVLKGGQCVITIKFTPSSLGPESGTLSVADTASTTPQTAALSGTGVLPAWLSVPSVNFGSIPQGTPSAAKTVTLYNNLTSALGITSIATGNSDYAETDTCTPSVPVGGHCVITITFTPGVLGADGGTLTITDTAPNSPQTATLVGTGLAQATVAPLALTLASPGVGVTSGAKYVTLTNNLATAVTVGAVTFTGANPLDFASPSNTCGGSLGAKSHCTFAVTFTPGAAGTRGATMNINDGANNTPQTVALTGTIY